MISPAGNYDIICLQMRNNISHLDISLKKATEEILAKTKAILKSGRKIKTEMNGLLPEIFNFRVRAIKWLFENEAFNIANLLDDVYPQLEELALNPKLEILAENILFAIRCNQRVVDNLVETEVFSNKNLTANFNRLPVITYEQFLASLTLTFPNEMTLKHIIEWVNSSLRIEIVILSATLIDEENINVSDKTINELSFFIADAAQQYSALASDLGLLKTGPAKQNHRLITLDKTFLKEQEVLAESGLDDFAENF